MTDYKIIELINRGARVYICNAGLSPHNPVLSFEITPEQFSELTEKIESLRTTKEEP